MDLPTGDAGPGINAAVWVLFGAALVAVCLRMAARARSGNSFGADDFVMVFALLCNLVGNIFLSISIHYGVGKHVFNVEPTDIPNAIKWSDVANAVALIADVFPKLAIALLINRLLNPSRLMYTFTLVVGSALCAIGIITAILLFQQCSPIEYGWNKEIMGTCWNPSVFANWAIFAGCYSAFCDLYLTLYPCVIVVQLNMTTRKKITMMTIFGLGLFAAFTTIYKTAVELPKIKHLKVDITYVVGQISLWTLIEASVTIVAGSVPTWGWLFRLVGFERFIEWITLRSLGSNRSGRSRGERVGSEDEYGNKKQDNGSDEGGSGKPGLDSIDQLERSANRV